MSFSSGYRITRVTTPADSLALVTLDQAKAALGIAPGDTSQDAALTQHIAAVSQAINNWCDRIFVMQVYRDQWRGACGWFGEPVVTRQYPIAVDGEGVPLVAVVEDGVALDPGYLEVYPETGALYRLDGGGPGTWGAGLLVIDYTAGYAEIPADVQGACLEWVGMRYGAVASGAVGRDPGLRSETIPDLITQVYSSSDTGGSSSAAASMPASVQAWLAPYRIWSV